MANIPRLTAGSSAEQVECCEELITEILSRVSTRDVLKMSTVVKRWRTMIFDPSFADTHYKNSHPESIFFFHEYKPVRGTMRETFQFRSYNPKTGNLSIVPFSWEGLDSSFLNMKLKLVSASNGLMCFFCPHEHTDFPVFWVYNPVTKFLKKLSVPIEEDIFIRSFVSICYTDNTGKLVMAGFSVDEKQAYTVVFDSQTNSWHKGPPLLRSIASFAFYSLRNPLFLNGVIYFIAIAESIDAEEMKETRDAEALFRDDQDFLYMIIGYDLDLDQWSFSIFIPASVGYPYCLIEWEGHLLVCAFNSTQEGNPFVLPASSTHDGNRRIRYRWDEGVGHFVFWVLDTKHKLWTRERELDLAHEFHYYWLVKVSASGGVVWFTCGYNSVAVYHMENRHLSTHRLDDDLALRERKNIECVSFEPTLLSF